MISRKKLLNYSSNYLESEIKQIRDLLKNRKIDKNSRKILIKLDKEYTKDLNEIDKEAGEYV